MEKKVILPITDENGYYQIRLESIGGLGANLCGKMLGELGLKYLGLNSASFSSYGSEKRGTPVKSFIRYSLADVDIKLYSPIINPHLLAVFHDALLSDKAVLKGCKNYTDIIVNTVNGSWLPEACFEACHCVYFLDAQKIAIETKSRVNVIMLGAIAKVMGFVELEDLNAICKDTLGRKYPASLSQNIEGIRRGYEEVDIAFENDRGKKQDGKGNAEEIKDDERKNNSADNRYDSSIWGYETAPIGGINPYFGNSVVNDLSPSRQGYFPIFIPEKCINCGLCDTTCPDMVFQFQKGEFKGREMMINKGLDYYHCKGCLRCVDVCPVQALVRGVEAEHPRKKYFMPNQELLRNPAGYEKAGYDGYITSEAFLTEQRINGGEV